MTQERIKELKELKEYLTNMDIATFNETGKIQTCNVEKLNEQNDAVENKLFELFDISDNNTRESLRRSISLIFHPDKNNKLHAEFCTVMISIINNANDKVCKEALQNKDKLSNLISNSLIYKWAFKRFFLNNDKIMFKEFCSVMPDIKLATKQFINENDSIIQEIKKLSPYADKLDNEADTPKYLNLIKESINIIKKSLSEKTIILQDSDVLTNISKELIHIRNEWEYFYTKMEDDKVLKNNLELLQDTITLIEEAKSTDPQKTTLQKRKDDIEEKIKSNTINIGEAATLYVVYTLIFAITAPLIQISLFGSMLLGGSTIGNIIFGAIASVIATTIAITISTIRNKVDSNKIFNILLLCAIFAYFIITSPLASLSSNIIFAIFSTAVIYNILNIIELLIKNIFSSKTFIILSFVKDIIIECLLIILLSIIAEPLLVILRGVKITYKAANKELRLEELCAIKNNILAHYFFAIIIELGLTFLTCIFLEPIIGNRDIFYFIICIFYDYLLGCIGRLPDIKMPKLYSTTVNYLSQILESICSNTIRCFDHSELIASLIKNIFNQYREIIPALPKISTSNKYLNYAIDNITLMVQSVIDLVLFPVFTILYPAYTALNVISQNTLETLHNHPFIVTAFFIATSVVSAVFANPIQLFILGTVVMNGYPVMNILFGTMSGILSTTFGTNAYVVINTAAIPYISSSLKGAKETFNSFCENYMPCFNNNSKDAPFTK